MNVMLIGIGYFPCITAGEKNFFYQLMPLLAQEGVGRLEVISINDQEEKIFLQEVGNSKIKIHNLKRPFHLRRKKFYKKIGNKIFYHHRHRPYQEILERFLTIVWYKKIIADLIKTSSIDLIHFMDNFGPVIPYLKKKFPKIKMTYAPANYDPRGRVYERYLKCSFKLLDRLSPFTEAYKQILLNLGIPENRMNVIHWGIKLPKKSLPRKEKKAIKRKFGCQGNNLLFLWSGWIQQIQENDFYYSIKEAREIVTRYEDIEFIFAFKPEIYQEKYTLESGEKVRVITDIENFEELLEAADIFFSPLREVNSTVSPPLTWLEAMAKGTPILTTKVAGVEELIINGGNGFIAGDFADILYKIEEIKRSNLEAISTKAKIFVSRNFNIEKAATNYIKFWKETINVG